MKICSVFKKIFGGRSHSKESCKNRLLLEEAEDVVESIRIRKGHVTFYVGEEEKVYQVPVEFVSFPPLKAVLKKSYEYEVYDIKTVGPRKLTCTPKRFEEIIKLAKKHQKRAAVNRHSLF